MNFEYRYKPSYGSRDHDDQKHQRSDIFQKEGLISPASCWMTNSAKHIANGVCEYTEELSQNSILLNKMAEDIQRKLDGKILHHEGIQYSENCFQKESSQGGRRICFHPALRVMKKYEMKKSARRVSS
jgi:hypothetical protein